MTTHFSCKLLLDQVPWFQIRTSILELHHTVVSDHFLVCRSETLFVLQQASILISNTTTEILVVRKHQKPTDVDLVESDVQFEIAKSWSNKSWSKSWSRVHAGAQQMSGACMKRRCAQQQLHDSTSPQDMQHQSGRFTASNQATTHPKLRGLQMNGKVVSGGASVYGKWTTVSPDKHQCVHRHLRSRPDSHW